MFKGWPPEALAWFEGIEANNHRAWWDANRDTYRRCVREPLEALLGDLAPEFGEARIFRPYRDTRFAADKRPYKENAAASVRAEPATAGLYLSVSADGLDVGAGSYMLARDQLERFRAAAASDRAGPALAEILATLDAAGLATGGEQLKTAPRGWPRDHARIDLLRRKGLYVMRHLNRGPWLHTAEARELVTTDWRATRPLLDWLEREVGPTTMPTRR
jgi:uncharacterized protein (TIGR02453 family)